MPGQEECMYVFLCKSMDLDETDVGHQAVLSDHVLFGQ